MITRVLSIISYIQLAAHQQRMKSMSNFTSVHSVAELTEDRNLVCKLRFTLIFLQYYHPVLIFTYVYITSYVSTFFPVLLNCQEHRPFVFRIQTAWR